MTSLLKKSASKVGSRNLDESSTVEDANARIIELRASIGTLTGRLDQFADDACLRRYLRARNWNIKKAEKMLKDTLAWRESYKPEDIRWSDIAGESETGKIYRASIKDKNGHTVLVMHPGRQNTSNPEMQIKQLVYFLENAVLNLPEGQEQMIWLIDFKGWSMKKSTPIGLARETANILQNHYPERLHVAVLYNPPRLFEAFWTIVKPFLDPKTFRKVKFVYSKNAESQKILSELFEENATKTIFEDPNDYTHEDYAKLMQEDDKKSALYWKGAGEAKTGAEPAADVQSKAADISEAASLKTEEGAAVNDAPASAPESLAPVAPAPVATPVVAPVS
ncbi:uncharacterized protein [Physcomitrium patens]|uniref:CRAL-TRIO domain-containing protein n=1 Tax=Physcomitrium patens TaxID=3218 RepID=A9TG24_PHYPA|nr:phosphatidylinositol transfer protein 3-like [Physcomitrium patens]XP_024393228.1 phosphatidylinositol transfer protein 3-like [Physcomitrium patens]XP_024393229.1 phosphatidylinositol transfer protein 3-like [Physcomitrium patens]XP_024393230.1 phosphatidylinositol transfer protein 3-like [Physcomitrium patens]XP_024393231.1 phosphatidylinositol transfer protein 3-like [Physcomitrium patens]PNR42784.1 hypothetical protein PHYPA_017614 [Physcomitrium patens]|eukprot:XP_024393227.1 phosphatidylinositol transfer protein 3-like [Physcomitrella patens]